VGLYRSEFLKDKVRNR